jgi:hypothetical protein
VSDAIGVDSRLAAARTREDQQRTFRRLDREALLRVQLVK